MPTSASAEQDSVERKFRKLEKAVAVRNSLLEKFSGKFRSCWKIPPRLSGSMKCYPCQGLGTFRQGKVLLENRLRLRECSWIFSSETVTSFLSCSEKYKRNFCDGYLFLAVEEKHDLTIDPSQIHRMNFCLQPAPVAPTKR